MNYLKIMINHNYDDSHLIVVQTLMTSLLHFSLSAATSRKNKYATRQPTSILCLNYVFLENRFNKKFLTCLSVNLPNSFSEIIS